jgi:hypothetical protein
MGASSASEEVTRSHEVDHALQLGAAKDVKGAKEEGEKKWAGQNGLAVVFDRIGDTLSDPHDSAP